MNYTALSLEQTPPLAVPARYFLTAPLFAAAAALVLLVEGPGALANRWPPAALVLTHLLTLGFVAMAMFGAVQQLLPVLAGSPIRRPLLVSRTLHALVTLGTLALAVGLWSGTALWLHAAGLLLGLLVVGFVAAAGLALLWARSGHATVRGMALSVTALAVTGILGLLLVGGHAAPGMRLFRELTDVHLAWGLAGWVGLLVIGVAYQVVPMFQITPDYPKAVSRWLAPAVFAGLVGWSAGTVLARWGMADTGWLATLGGLVVAGGLAAFAVTTLYLQMRRRRRLPDVTLTFWRIGMVSLLLAVVLWLVAVLRPEAAGGLAMPLGVAMVVGFAVSVINGMLYKIVPFLVWLHLNNRLQMAGAWQGKVPNMKQVIPDRRARPQLWLHAAAVAALLAATVLPGALAYLAGFLLLASNLLLGANLLGAVMLYRRMTREMG